MAAGDEEVEEAEVGEAVAEGEAAVGARAGAAVGPRWVGQSKGGGSNGSTIIGCPREPLPVRSSSELRGFISSFRTGCGDGGWQPNSGFGGGGRDRYGA